MDPEAIGTMLDGLAAPAAAWLLTLLAHGTVVLGGTWLLARWLRSPAAREAAWKAALVLPLVTASASVWLGPLGVPAPAGEATSQAGGWRSWRISIAPAASEGVAAPAAEDPLPIPWRAGLVGAWLGGASLALLHLGLKRRRALRGLGRRRAIDDAGLRRALRELGSAAGIDRAARVRLTTSSHLLSPVALSGLEICLPARAASELDEPMTRALLAHELTHVLRRDPAWHLAARILERLFFVQPLLHLASRRLQDEAELLCDDWAARHAGGGMAMARCLAAVAGWMGPKAEPLPTPGMARDPSALVRRVERQLAGSRSSAWLRSASLPGFLLAAILGGGACLCPSVEVEEQEPAEPAANQGQAEEDAERRAIEEKIKNYLNKEEAESGAGGEEPSWPRLSVTEEGFILKLNTLDSEGPGFLTVSTSTYSPSDGEDFSSLLETLRDIASLMPTEPAGSSGLSLPSGKLVVRVYPAADFRLVLKVLELCGRSDVGIWNIELSHTGPAPATHPVPLPIETPVGLEGPSSSIDLGLDVSGGGEQRVVRYRLDGAEVADEAALRELLDARRDRAANTRVAIDAQCQARFDDVARVLDLLTELGFADICFVADR